MKDKSKVEPCYPQQISYKELKRLVRDLLWNMCRQQEKVGGNLRVLCREIYKDTGLTDEQIAEIARETVEKIRGGVSTI